MARKSIIKVSKSKESKYAHTASNKERRAAQRARRIQKDALTFTSRGRFFRRLCLRGPGVVGE